MRGKIVKILDSYGFIEAKNSESYYFNKNCLTKGLIFSSLKEGDNMEFDVERLRDGKTRAINCKVIEDETIVYLKENALKLYELEKDYDIFCDHVLEYANKLKIGSVTTSMIRKTYSRILAANDVMEVKMLRPQFAYISGRNEDNPTLREFMEILNDIVKNMNLNNDKELDSFKQFMEAIVAYRKYVGRDK